VKEVQDSHWKRLCPTFTSVIVENLSHLDSLDNSLLHDVITNFAKLCKIKHGTMFSFLFLFHHLFSKHACSREHPFWPSYQFFFLCRSPWRFYQCFGQEWCYPDSGEVTSSTEWDWGRKQWPSYVDTSSPTEETMHIHSWNSCQKSN